MLPKSKRLKRDDFSKISTRAIIRGNFFDIVVSPSLSSRFACIATKKRIRRAIDRNTVRRRIYQAIAHQSLTPHRIVIVYPKQSVLNAPYSKIEEEMRSMFATL